MERWVELKESDTLRIFNMAELEGAISHFEPAATPDDPRLPYAEWYCINEECCVREVRINAKLLDPEDTENREPTCPWCAGRLKFHHYLKERTFLREDAK